jgi:EF hand
MSLRVVALLTGAALVLAGPATAGEKHKHKHKEVERTCVCTMGHGPGVAPVAPLPAIPAVPPVPPVPHGAWQMHMGHPGSANVMVYRDDGDERVVIVRKHGKRFRDSADENNDGEVSRREFIRRAEKHFKERDRDGDGKLDGDEMGPMQFEVPMPPEPPEPPEAPDPEDE